MSLPDVSPYDEALAQLDRQSAEAGDFCASALAALVHGLGCRWALAVETRGRGHDPVLLASHGEAGQSGPAAIPFAELPSAPPFRADSGQRYWFIADNLRQQGGEECAGLHADVVSCHGHVLENAAGQAFGYVLALDCRAMANDSAAAMFFRLVAERISAAAVQAKLLAARRLAQQRAQDFAEAGADWFWELDADLRICFVSSSFEKRIGEPSSLHLGRTRQEMLGADYDHAFWRDHLAVLAEHRPFSGFVYPYRTLDGRALWLRASGKPVFEPGGDFAGYRCAGSDVTASVLADIELRNSGNRFRGLLDNSPMGVIITKTTDGTILFANQWWTEFYGKPVAEMLGTKIAGFYSDSGSRGKIPERLRLEGSVRNEEFKFLNSDRRLVWILVSMYHIEFEGEDAILSWIYDIDERKRAETEVRASEQRFRDLAEGSIQGMVIVDQDWRPLFVNQALAEIFGYDSPETILAWDNLSVFFDEPEADRIRSIMKARFDNEPAPTIYEAMGQRKDGKIVWLQLQGRIVTWKNLRAIQVTIVDITERRAAEEAVRESEQRFHDFADASSDWFWETDAEHRITYISPGFERYTGISPDGLLGEDRRQLLTTAAETPDKYEVLRKLEAREPIRDLIQLYHPPGNRPLWIRSGLTPIHDRNGDFIGYRGATANITAEVESRQRLQSIADRYLNAIDNLSDGVALWDADDRLVICNKRFQNLSSVSGRIFQPGLTFEESVRATAAAGNFVVQGEALEIEIRSRIENHRNLPCEIELRRNDRILEVREQRTPEGGTITIVIDVTQQRQAEDQLRQAQKMEAVGQLTGGIAHDFNNLLAVLSGNLELLDSRAKAYPELSRFIDRGLAAAERGAQLTQRLLSFSRDQPLATQSTTLDRLIGGMQDMVQHALGETIQVKAIIGADPWPCLVDTAQLENAILNLAINARDAMPRGGTLSIEAGNADLTDSAVADRENVAPGLYVVLSVRDTGTGMPKEVVERAFDPFFTTKDAGKGSGLGLSMVYRFVQQTGGQVRIDSEVGRGTTVKIYLPRGPDTEPDDRPQAKPAGNRAGNNETILVVEDDREVRDIAVAMLHELGYQVLQTGEGNAAMELIAAKPQLDLLLSDVVLPEGMSGKALAERARNVMPNLKVLFMSGYALDAFAADGGPDPGDRVLGKPFRRAELAEMVRQALDAG